MKITKRILLILSVVALLVGCFAFSASAAEGTLAATFELGADGTASHNDGSSATSYTETDGDYTLTLSGLANVYKNGRDALGNGCLKLGSSSKAGSFTFTVPSDVTSVVIYVAQYKSNTTKLSVNGTNYTVSGASNDGAYDKITVDTSTTKTVTLTTVSGGYRAMVNTIEFYAPEQSNDPVDYSFVVPYGCEVPPSGSATELQLPAGPTVNFGNGKYVFAGWSTSLVENTTEAPETFAAGEVYKLTKETTFYAVYTYEKDVEVETTVYQKVTEEPADWSGTYLIVCEEGNFVFNGGLAALDAVSNTISVTIENGQIVLTDDINNCQFEIAKVEGGYTILSNSGMYIGQTSDANGLASNSSKQYVNTITLDAESNINIVSGGAYLRFNAASNQMRFRYYKSSSYTSQKAIQLYKLVTSGGSTTTQTKTFYTSFEADFYSANVRLEESLLVNYYVALNTSYDVENLKMVFTMNGEATGKLAGVVAEDGRLVFTFDGIAPQYMGANISAELYNGDAVADTMANYSIKTNLEAIYPEDKTSELAKLIDATLAYGAAAEYYTDPNTEGSLENLGAVAEDGAVSNATYAQDGYVIGASVFFDGLNRVAIFVDKNDVTITCTVGGEAVEVSELVYSSEAEMYYVLLEPVYASGIEDVYTITVTNNAGTVATIEYNVHAYCYAHQNDEDVDTKNLAVAYYNYGVAALAYNN